ncbi:MAG: hypothetical protein IIA67_01075 [Planctomycetes bacterium]|nr:hypothetical protein [Planctomycetota bacterium]
MFLASDGDVGRRLSPPDAEPLDERNSEENDLDAKVRDLVQREIQAGRLLYGAAEMAELEARGALLIEWLDQGQFPATDQVDQLQARVNELEERVTLYLARDYRISVYNTYRTDREEYDHRRARWNLIDQRWRKFEHTPQRRAHLNQWLAEAIEVSRPGSTTPLPPPPAWYYEPVEVLAAQEHSGSELAGASERSDPFDVSSPGDYIDSTFDSSTLSLGPSRDSLPRRKADDSLTETERSDLSVPTEIAPQDDPPQPGLDRRAVDPSNDATPDDFDSAQSSALPEDLIKRGRDELPSAEVDLTDLVVGAGDDEPRETAVVNVDLLRARVAGHNLAVLQLADELGGRDRWTATALAPHVDRLIDLHQRRNDLVVFVELTEPQKRREFQPLESTRQVVTLLAEQIVGARLWAMGNNFEGNSQQRQAELAALANFSRRLAKIAFDSPRALDAELHSGRPENRGS